MSVADNLLGLENPCKEKICEELKRKFEQRVTYSFAGGILISINPNEPTDSNASKVDSESKHLSGEIDAFSTKAYIGIRKTRRNFCIVPSGISGSGKSYCCQLVIRNLTGKSCRKDVKLSRKIVMANSVLESFTNVRTFTHSNSTRVAKMTRLFFGDRGDCLKASLHLDLLETHRLTSLRSTEGTFHIFYYLFAGVEKERLEVNCIKDIESHEMVKMSDGSTYFTDDSHFDDCQRKWVETVYKLSELGFTTINIDGILAVLVALIHMRDFKFTKDEDYDGVDISPECEQTLQIVSEFLGLSTDDFVSFLITSITVVKGEKVGTLRNVEEAKSCCHTVIRHLYRKLVDWIVFKANQCLISSVSDSTWEYCPSLTILDAPGQEINQRLASSLEQLMVNSFNERIESFYVQKVFKEFRERCEAEGVEVDFSEKTIFPGIDLRPIFLAVTIESVVPKASDISLLERITKEMIERKGFELIEDQKHQFLIRHTFSPVVYSINGFLEKNKNPFEADLLKCFEKTESQFVAEMLYSDQSSNKKKRISRLLSEPIEAKAREKPKDFLKKIIQRKPATLVVVRNKVSELSVIEKFEAKLSGIFATLNSQACFIRCISLNATNDSQMFDVDHVTAQISSLKLPETVSMLKRNYSVCFDMEEFYQKFKNINLPDLSLTGDHRIDAVKILKAADPTGLVSEKNEGQIFLKYDSFARLNNLIEGLYQNLDELSPGSGTNECNMFRNRSEKCISLTVKKLFDESMAQLPNKNVWIKMCFLEDDYVTKFYGSQASIAINNSSRDYDGSIVGINNQNFAWTLLKLEKRGILKLIGEGLVLKRDQRGNIYAQKYQGCGLHVVIRRTFYNCVPEATANRGVITEALQKIFDMSIYKQRIFQEIFSPDTNIIKLDHSATITLDFCELNTSAVETKCSLFIINYLALDLLGDMEGKVVKTEEEVTPQSTDPSRTVSRQLYSCISNDYIIERIFTNKQLLLY